MFVFRKESIQDLGKRLKELREEKNLTAKELGNSKLLKPCTICRIEQGKINPKLSTLIRYSITLDIPLTEMLEGIQYIKEVDDRLEDYEY